MDIHLGGGIKGGGRVLDYRVILQTDPEHSRIAYHYAVTVRPV